MLLFNNFSMVYDWSQYSYFPDPQQFFRMVAWCFWWALAAVISLFPLLIAIFLLMIPIAILIAIAKGK
jgi:hypothetical protein